MLYYNQFEWNRLIIQYYNTDSKTIKKNFIKALKKRDIKPKEIIGIGYKPNTVYAWTRVSHILIPKFEQMLNMAVNFDFSIFEILREGGESEFLE